MMQNSKYKRIIIGAGPAGINAAIMLAKQGLKSILIDENPNIGGAIFRHTKREYDKYPLASSKTYKRGVALKNEYHRYRDFIQFKPLTHVAGTMTNEHKISVFENEQLYELEADHFIVSTGAHERIQPFPGWTLPGVMGVGGVELQIKTGFVQPGKNIVLIGTGPILLVTAKKLHQAGVKVKGVFEAGRFIDLVKYFPRLLNNLSLLSHGIGYQLYLAMSRIPFHYGWGIVEAKGDDTLKEVVVAPYDREWRPNLQKAISIQTDCIGVNYGFVCRSHLTHMMGCEHIYVKNQGGFQPKKDEWQRTSKKHIYTAGDSSGFNGAEVSELEGQIAAIASMMDVKDISVEHANKLAKPINKKLKRLYKFRNALDKFSEIQPGLLDLPKDDTIICRCENIPLSKIKNALSKGIHTETALKMSTRLGMGDCQGKVCGSFSSEYASKVSGFKLDKVGIIRPRFPLSPIPFSAYLKKER